MLDFLQANLGTIAVAALLVTVLLAAFLKIRRDKKKGGGCGCGCAGCPSAGMCSQSENKGNKR